MMKFNYPKNNCDKFLKNNNVIIKSKSKLESTKKSAIGDCIFAKQTTTDNVSNLSFIDSMIGWSLNLF